MGFCQEHWDGLRARIDERGLSHLIADDGAAAARRMKAEIEDDGTSAKSFDPLLSAYFAILSNAGHFVGPSGSALYVMTDGDEDPIEDPILRARAGLPVGATWPRCAVCYLNLAHKATCTDKRCKLDKERGYDWMLDRAADDALTKARELDLLPEAKP